MKNCRLIGAFALCIVMSSSLQAQSQKKVVDSTDVVKQYQDMLSNASGSIAKEYKQIDKIYKKILLLYKTDTLFITEFKKSQKKWFEFVDSYMKSVFPEGPNAYGEVNPECRAEFLLPLLEDRAKQLNLWIKGASDDEACTGSIKSSEELKKRK